MACQGTRSRHTSYAEDMSTSTPRATCPSVHHPTISEYYPLVLRLGDYLKYIIAPTDWPVIWNHAPDSSQGNTAQRDLVALLSEVLVSFSEPQAAAIKRAWPAGESLRVGLQIQSQEDVSEKAIPDNRVPAERIAQLVSNVLMKRFRRGTQKKPMARLSDIDILLKGYVVSRLPAVSYSTSDSLAACRRRQDAARRDKQGSTGAVAAAREWL